MPLLKPTHIIPPRILFEHSRSLIHKSPNTLNPSHKHSITPSRDLSLTFSPPLSLFSRSLSHSQHTQLSITHPILSLVVLAIHSQMFAVLADQTHHAFMHGLFTHISALVAAVKLHTPRLRVLHLPGKGNTISHALDVLLCFRVSEAICVRGGQKQGDREIERKNEREESPLNDNEVRKQEGDTKRWRYTRYTREEQERSMEDIDTERWC